MTTQAFSSTDKIGDADMASLLENPIQFLRRVALATTVVLAAVGPTSATEIGDIENGQKVFRKCQSCHKVGENAKNGTGPHLNEMFDRTAGGLEGFRYSKSMKRAGADGLVWTPEKLDLFLENPKNLVSGTKMRFRGLKDEDDRRDVLAYLRQFSANPQDIPESSPTAESDGPEISKDVLAIVGDHDYGAYLSSECTTCHQASGADKGIPSITGWPSDDFVIAMHAYKEKYRPHPVMQMIAGRLSNDEIASLATYFNSLGE